jgi:hypothetical protein
MRGEHGPAECAGRREVDADPPDLPVVDTPELGLEAFTQGDDGPAGMGAQERADPRVEGPGS